MDAATKTILLVEDEAIVAMAEKSQLERFGYGVITANSGERAVELAKGNSVIDAILMDIDLGKGMDGTQAAQNILMDRDIPIVFVSSHTEPEVVKKTENITSYGYVVKSSSITVLDASIKMAFKLFDSKKNLIRSQEKQETIMASISDVVGITDMDGIIKYLSPNIERWFGWKPGELIGIDLWTLVHPEDLELSQGKFRDLAEKDNSTKTIEYRNKCRDGSYKWIELTATNLDKDPNIRGIVMNYHDITERKSAEEATRKSENYLRNLFDILPVGISIVDSNDTILDSNKQLEAILGIDKAQIEKKAYRKRKYLRSDESEMAPDEFPSAIALKSKSVKKNVEIGIVKEDNAVVWTNVSAAALPFQENACVIVTTDITRQKHKENLYQARGEQFALTLDAVNDGLWNWDVKSGNAYFSTLYYTLLGYEDGEFPATYDSWRSLVHPDDIERVERELSKGVTLSGRFSIDLRMRGKDGAWLWVSTRGRATERDSRGRGDQDGRDPDRHQPKEKR